MGDNRVTRIWPTYVQSVGQMRDQHVRVAAVCSQCRQWQKVDLDAIIMLRGRSFCLIDQRGPCRIYQCDGTAFFMWSTGDGTPYRPLTTERGNHARMFAKGQGEEPPPDDEPPEPLPPAPAGVSREAWAKADSYERKRLLREARGQGGLVGKQIPPAELGEIRSALPERALRQHGPTAVPSCGKYTRFSAAEGSRDRDAEMTGCDDVSVLQEELAKAGGGLVIEKARPIGAVPLKRIALGLGGGAESTAEAPALKELSTR